MSGLAKLCRRVASNVVSAAVYLIILVSRHDITSCIRLSAPYLLLAANSRGPRCPNTVLELCRHVPDQNLRPVRKCLLRGLSLINFSWKSRHKYDIFRAFQSVLRRFQQCQCKDVRVQGTRGPKRYFHWALHTSAASPLLNSSFFFSCSKSVSLF